MGGAEVSSKLGRKSVRITWMNPKASTEIERQLAFAQLTVTMSRVLMVLEARGEIST